MNVLFFLPSLASGGAERVTATLANYWSANGWKVTLVTIDDVERDFYQLDPGVHRIALKMGNGSRTPVNAVLNNLRRVGALYLILKQIRPEVAISMMPAANVILALAGRLAGIPTVGSERTYPPAMPLGRLWETARRSAYPLLSGLVAQTNITAEWLRVHTSPRRIAVIANPVNYPIPAQPNGLRPESVCTRLIGERILLAVGRLEEEKCFDRLITAFATNANLHHNWSLVILGEGSLRLALAEQVKRLGLDKRVMILGAVGNVGDWFANADAFVMTSRFEGFPNALLEALAYGVPSLAVDCKTGPSELIETEVNGLLVPQDDPLALSAGLGRLMKDPELRARFAKRAVNVREIYAVERIAEKWRRFILSVIRLS